MRREEVREWSPDRTTIWGACLGKETSEGVQDERALEDNPGECAAMEPKRREWFEKRRQKFLIL